MNCSKSKKEKKTLTPKEWIKKILSGFVTVILVITVGISMILMVKNATGQEPAIFGYRFFYVVTGSMEPTIHSGSAALVHKETSYQLDDIITFSSSDAAILGQANTHRIIGTDGKDSQGNPIFITKGDANNTADEARVTYAQIYGKVVFHTGELTGLGTLIGFVMTPMGFISAVVMPVMLIIFFYAKDFARQYREAAEKEKAENGETEETGPKLSKEEAEELLRLAAAFKAEKSEEKAEKNEENSEKNAENVLDLTEKTQGGGTL